MTFRFRWLATLLAALPILAWTDVAAAFSYYPATPQGPVGVSRPAILQQFLLDPGEEFLRARMWLDGRSVQPTWNGRGTLSYTPPAPLSPGAHSVRLSVEIAPAKPGYVYDPVVSNFTIQVADGAVESLPAPGPEELRALEHVNAYRAAAGLQSLAYSPALGVAAREHARYLIVNPVQRTADPHHQREGTQRFFGASPGDRVAYYGYGNPNAEVINFVPRAEDAVDGWMATLYHRIPLVHPGSFEMGYGLAGAGDANFVDVLETGQAETGAGASLWPWNGQTDVPWSWDGAEVPDPFDLYPGVKGPVGYPVTLTFGGAVNSLTLRNASLTGPGGEVAVMRFSPANDSRLKDTVALIPYAPLRPGTTYSVRLTGEVDLGSGPQPYDRRWSFTTTGRGEFRVSNRVITINRDRQVKSMRIDGVGFSQGTRFFMNGLPVEGLSVDSATRATFLPPAGFAGGTADLLAVAADGTEYQWPEFVRASDGFQYGSGGEAFTPTTLQVNGRAVGATALLHRSGAVLLPESALEALGARQSRVPENGRVYWTYGGRTGDYTPGYTAASVAGSAVSLALPVLTVDGVTYVDAAFARRLTDAGVVAGGGQVAVGTAVEGMYDIAGHWAKDAVARLVKAGIVSGNGDGTFRPDAALTRAAFVKMLAGARRIPAAPGSSTGFADTAGHWVATQGYLGAAVQAGILVPAEYPGGRFEPDRPITREEIAVMVTRALGQDALAAGRRVTLTGGLLSLGGRSFADAGAWSRPGYVAQAVEVGIVAGYKEADGTYTFRPDRQATRAEAAVMSLRAMEAR